MYHPYYGNYQSYHYGYQPVYWAYPNQVEQAPRSNTQNDFGPRPFVIDIEEATKRNKIIVQHCGQGQTYK